MDLLTVTVGLREGREGPHNETTYAVIHLFAISGFSIYHSHFHTHTLQEPTRPSLAFAPVRVRFIFRSRT